MGKIHWFIVILTIGLVTAFVTLAKTGVVGEEKFLIQDNHLILGTKVTDIEEEKIGKNSYEYYLFTEKEGSTYRFKLTKEEYNELKNIATNSTIPKLDIVFQQGVYAEKVAIGISFSNKRR